MTKAFVNIALTLIVLMMASAAFTYLAPHLGWRVDCLLSGSMEPQLKAGDLIVTRPVVTDTIIPGDIIVFRRSVTENTFLCHRVIGVERHSAPSFETKGDANDNPDPFVVPSRDVAGEVCFHAPFLGHTVQFLKTPAGFTLALLVPGLLLTAIYIRNICRAFAESRTPTCREDSGDEN